MTISLITWLDEQIGRHRDRPAVQYRPRYRTQRWRYAELGAHVARLERDLAAAGVGPGDRVLLLAENSPFWVAAFFAVLARGAVLVPLNPSSPPSQIDRIAASAEPRLALRSTGLPWLATPLPNLPIDAAGTIADSPPRPPPDLPDENTLAEILYTSGTTGDPKGVMLSHGNLLANMSSVSLAVPLRAEDHVLNLLPLFHVFGQMTGMLGPLACGCAVSYVAAPTSRAIMEVFAQTPVTHFIAIPEVLKTMMDRLESRLGRIPGWARPALRSLIRRRISPTLRTIISGGAPLDPILEEKWWSLGFEVLQGYGLTETSPVVAANTPTTHRIGTVGKPLTGVEVRIAPDGEILVRGRNVMQGYYKNPEQTAAVLQGGWFRTGDGGSFDPDGFLHVSGRKKYMILGPNGENVFPEDIEGELNRQPGVVDSAVVGLDSNARTVIYAALLCDPERAADIVANANRHLAPHQRIMDWSVWPEPDFPRSVTRKVRKDAVIDRLKDRADLQRPTTGRITPLMRLVAEVTGTELAKLEDSVRLVPDLGLDSLLRIELVSRIESRFGVYLEELQITATTTLAELGNLIELRKNKVPLPTHYPRWSQTPWAQALRPLVLGVFFRSWILRCCRLRIEGIDRLQDVQGPVIFMANHRSYLDSAIASFASPQRLGARLAIAASTEVLYRKYRWAVPLGELALNAFPFPTGAGENIRPGLDLFGHLLDDRWNVLIFPEGRMNRSGVHLQALKAGTGVIAVEMGVPIVPMIIDGTEKVMPPGTILPRTRAEVRVRLGDALPVRAGESYEQAAERIETALRKLLSD